MSCASVTTTRFFGVTACGSWRRSTFRERRRTSSCSGGSASRVAGWPRPGNGPSAGCAPLRSRQICRAGAAIAEPARSRPGAEQRREPPPDSAHSPGGSRGAPGPRATNAPASGGGRSAARRYDGAGHRSIAATAVRRRRDARRTRRPRPRTPAGPARRTASGGSCRSASRQTHTSASGSAARPLQRTMLSDVGGEDRRRDAGVPQPDRWRPPR